jgi:hypothetical protein
MNAEKLEADAEAIITRDLLKLPPGVQSGTARALVRCLVDAAVARIKEAEPAKPAPRTKSIR